MRPVADTRPEFRICALCGAAPATGYATINDRWYCHDGLEPSPTCYERTQARFASYRANGVDLPWT